MRRVRYSVAMSLDGYVAGPKGESEFLLAKHRVYAKTGTVALEYEVA